MHAFRPTPRWLALTSDRATRAKIRDSFAANVHDYNVPTIPACPLPTCECAEMPAGLDIDRTRDLNGTIAAYSEHVVVTTGQADWKSKIEDERDGAAPWGVLTARLKALLGPKRQFFDAYRNTLVSASSFSAPGDPATSRPQEAQRENEASQTTRGQPQAEVKSSPGDWEGRVRSIDAPTILVCSHNSRDSRCGILGPLLHAEFEQYINGRHTLHYQTTSGLSSSEDDSSEDDSSEDDSSEDDSSESFASHPMFRPESTDADQGKGRPINVGMVSHIGGHKWAGNVIVYIPPGYQMRPLQRMRHGAQPRDEQQGSELVVAEDEITSQVVKDRNVSPLAGKGIWYGRVEPRHVQGIVEMTIGHGQIIRELFRGGVHQDGTPIRL